MKPIADLFELSDQLRNPDRGASWSRAIRNQQSFWIRADGVVVPIHLLAHVYEGYSDSDTRDRSSSAAKRLIKSELKRLGYSEVVFGHKESENAYHKYIDVFQLHSGSSSHEKVSIRRRYFERGMTSFFVRTSPTRQDIISAMQSFETQGTPKGFDSPKSWFAVHPETGKIYPAKIVWGLATSQQGKDFTSHNARDALRKLGLEVIQIDDEQQPLSPLELSELPVSIEGAERQVTRNIRERDPNARRRCIAAYRNKNGGRLSCIVCGIEFGKIYGDLGEGFIHVHHLDPIAQSNGPREILPEIDLVPVCPNCHAMLHRRTPPLTISELNSILLSRA